MAWQFRYPGHDVTVNGTPQDPPVLVMPEGKLTQINLYSADVVPLVLGALVFVQTRRHAGVCDALRHNAE